MPKLTDAAARRLPGPPPGKPYAIHWDDALKGFALRVLAGSGRRNWTVKLRVGGVQRWVTLGTTAELDAAEAREQAKGILARANLGHDAQAEIRARRAEAKAMHRGAMHPEPAKVLTVGELARLHLDAMRLRLRPTSLKERAHYLEKAWAPLHGRPAGEVERKEVAALVQAMATGRGPIAANRARAALGAMYGWGMRQGLVEADPVSGTARPAEETRRDRVPSLEELAAIWRCAEGMGGHGAIVRLLILTGQRRGEVGGMRWSELHGLDGPEPVWRLPGARTKNKRPHAVLLSPQAVAVLRTVPRRTDRDHLFGDRSAEGFDGWSLAKRRLDAKLAKAGHALPPWTLHDLRRSVVTHMHETGTDPHVVEAVVNHVSGVKAGVAGVYNRSLLDGPKRAALARWGAFVGRLAEGGEESRVVPLKRPA